MDPACQALVAGCIAFALPEQPVVKRLQWTRRAKHWLHRICTSRTASGQEAAVDPACQALVAGCIAFALPEQPVVKRLQWTRRAKHWLHRICTSRTASGQEALSRMLSPC